MPTSVVTVHSAIPLACLIPLGRTRATLLFAPVELMARYADGPAVLHGGVSSRAITSGVAENLTGKDDDVIIADLEVRVPALIASQGFSQRRCYFVGYIIGGLEVQKSPDTRLVGRR
ncbi:hypothetical protein [Micromonospora tarensis]|uniref:Uncharacterized protein n=1 Tax=Micromonospora tarensis TaxID=2806100 RepID=A0ABS1Y9L8_9ACTN|nr:hypothetical protein [Micromonospora tarensis]MBM0274047.1 hypothetical protein [Micromonospora tarensis]